MDSQDVNVVLVGNDNVVDQNLGVQDHGKLKNAAFRQAQINLKQLRTLVRQ